MVVCPYTVYVYVRHGVQTQRINLEILRLADELISGKVAANLQKLHTLQQLTKLLPDGTWLQELDISEDTVDINGFSNRAADLPPPLENSPYFTQVEFTAPITRDNQNREIFRIRMRLKQAHH